MDYKELVKELHAERVRLNDLMKTDPKCNATIRSMLVYLVRFKRTKDPMYQDLLIEMAVRELGVLKQFVTEKKKTKVKKQSV